MLKHYSSFCFIFCLFLPLMSKADFERVVRPLQNGTLVLNSRCRASLMRFTPEWKPVSQYQARPDAGYPRSSAERFELRGTFDAFRMNEVVTATGSDTFHYSMELSAENPVPCNLLFLGINLPLGKGIRVEIDGKPVAMPEQYKTKKVFDASAQSVTVKDPQGEFTITGNCHLILIGKFLRDGEEYYQLRLLPAGKHPKTVKFWKLELDFQLHFSRPGIDSQPIDLATLFNRGFRSGEGAPAWTGQGAVQEPRTLQPGEYRFHGIRIHIADPGRNHGRTCLILGRDLGPKSAGVDIANFPEQAKYLYLFHAAAWPPMLLKPLGAIELGYEDGSSEKLPVIAGRDCDNWFRRPMVLPNASPVWKTELAGSPAGLYLSAFPLKKKVRRIDFRLAAANSAWIIATASFSDGRAEFPAPEPLVVKSGPEWLPIQFKGETVKGSPLDFSCFRDLPAGKHGRIVSNAEGHLVFENAPEKRIRLFGTNLVGTANFLEREDVERFLSAIERLGYNTVRLHHFEEGILKRDAADSVTLDPAKLDQFHYLISRLKERGFYISLDLYASRKLKSGDNIPEFDNTGDYSMKNLVCISPAALENWKSFARNLLTAPNPYTGMTLAEDPVLCSMNLVNENPLTGIWNHARSSRAAQKLYRQKFEEYLRSQKTAPDGKSVTRNGLFIEFLNALQLRCIKEQMRFLKEELGVKALLTDLNCYAEYSLAEVRSELDLVDHHQYWDHAQFPGKRGGKLQIFHNESAIARQGGAAAVDDAGPGLRQTVPRDGVQLLSAEHLPGGGARAAGRLRGAAGLGWPLPFRLGARPGESAQRDPETEHARHHEQRSGADGGPDSLHALRPGRREGRRSGGRLRIQAGAGARSQGELQSGALSAEISDARPVLPDRFPAAVQELPRRAESRSPAEKLGEASAVGGLRRSERPDSGRRNRLLHRRTHLEHRRKEHADRHPRERSSYRREPDDRKSDRVGAAERLPDRRAAFTRRQAADRKRETAADPVDRPYQQRTEFHRCEPPDPHLVGETPASAGAGQCGTGSRAAAENAHCPAGAGWHVVETGTSRLRR